MEEECNLNYITFSRGIQRERNAQGQRTGENDTRRVRRIILHVNEPQ